ncbi:MAG TPA: sigma-70 family RNA polymerase sigma factor [Acidimicrobiia bacterium]|nr:sigma-70 family RNA polymerase sigma factor [Acidimicrobiia bacterium]
MTTGQRLGRDHGTSSRKGIDFDAIWEHRQELHDMCERIVGDSALADDLVQETYLQVLRNIDRLEVRDGLMPWLVTVAKRRSLNELRRHRYSTPVDAVPDRSTVPEADPCEAAALSDEVRRVKEALEGLTPRERDLLLRQVYRGMSLAELADEDASTAASVRSVLNRARSKIRGAVSDGGALVLVPLGTAGSWMRRRVEAASARLQSVGDVTVGYARLGEIVAAGVITATLAGTGAPTPSGDVTLAGPSPDVAFSDASSAPLTTTPPAQPVQADAAPVVAEPATPPTTEPPAPPVPDPTDVLPIDPADPLPRADEPEEAHYQSFAAGGDGSGETFALGQASGKCHIDCVTLFRSQDGGATWERLPAKGLNATKLMLPSNYPTDPRIFASGEGGLQVSRDGGQTFDSVVGLPGGPTAMSPDFEKRPTILVGAAPGWRYDARTGHHKPMTGAPASTSTIPFAFAPDFRSSKTVYAGAFTFTGDRTQAAVYTCSSTTNHMTCRRHVALPALDSSPSIAAMRSGGVVFAWGEQGFFWSGDRAASFTEVELPFHSVTGVTEDGAGNFYVAGYTRNEDGMSGGVARSTDRGRTWTTVGQDTRLADGAQAVSASGRRILAAPLESAGGGLLCSLDAGATWQTRCA